MNGHSSPHLRLRFPACLALLAGCFMLCSCEAFQQENRTFFSTSHDQPTELRFNVAKRGYMHSPYAPDAGWVDVRGIEPGTLVQCPYTGRFFVVPAYTSYR